MDFFLQFRLDLLQIFDVAKGNYYAKLNKKLLLDSLVNGSNALFSDATDWEHPTT